MSTTPPLQYGGTYHVYNRGNNRENIFIEEHNYRYFMKLYAKYIEQVADTFAYDRTASPTPRTAATQGTKDQPVPSLSKFTPHLLRGMKCGRLVPGG